MVAWLLVNTEPPANHMKVVAQVYHRLSCLLASGPFSFNPFQLFVLILCSSLWRQPSNSCCCSRRRRRHSCWPPRCSSIPPASNTALPGPPSQPPPPRPWRRSPCLSPYRSHRWVRNSVRAGAGSEDWSQLGQEVRRRRQLFLNSKPTFWLLAQALRGLRSCGSVR